MSGVSGSPELSGLRVLAAFAHPDDEGFGCGGTLAMLADQGARITLACFTDGDAAWGAAAAGTGRMGARRRDELRAAARVLGISEVRFLGYRDSGWAASRRNPHPLALHHVKDKRAVVSRVVRLLRELLPGIVITHDPTGGYGHVDHVTVCGFVTEAVREAGRRGDDDGPVLYHVCFPRRVYRPMWREMIALGIVPPFGGATADRVGTPDDAVTTVVDARSHAAVKIASLRCHASQLSDRGPFHRLPERVLERKLAREYFTLALPAGAGPEADVLSRAADAAAGPRKRGG